jgi:coiled-coil domain-containing protein 55
MNINLALSKKKKTTNSLKMGVNARASNVFGDDGDEEGSDASEPDAAAAVSSSSRAKVNQAVALEQQALRQRAAAAAAAAATTNTDMYDYDGVYDSMHPVDTKDNNKPESSTDPHNQEKPKSRYIEDLLKASKERQLQRELVMERRITKEQEAESQQAEYAGKEQFITAAYKRKLQERQVWLEQEKERDDKEQNNMEKMGMAGFYSGLQNNVALGGVKREEVKEDQQDHKQNEIEGYSELGFLDGFEQPPVDLKKDQVQDKSLDSSTADNGNKSKETGPTKRELREQKVAEARIRFFKRHKMAAE